MKPRFCRARLAGTILGVMAAAGLAFGAEGSFDRTLTVSGAVDLEVTTGSGGIHVRTGDSSAVRVHGTIRARGSWSGISPEEKVRRLEANPPIEQAGSLIRIGSIEDPELGRNVSISYDLIVPAETHLHSQTGSGDQSVDGIRGPLRASTGSGGLRLTNIGSEVRAETGSGDIHLESIAGSVTASTGSGSIRAAGVAGEFSGEAGSGDVRLQQSAPGRVKVSTGSGSIELGGVQGPLRADTGSGEVTVQGELTGDWHLETGSGGITVRLPSQAAFDLHAHTSSGSISTDGHAVTLEGTLSRNDWRGKVGAGGYLLEVKTGSGNIRIE